MANRKISSYYKNKIPASASSQSGDCFYNEIEFSILVSVVMVYSERQLSAN